ncbi:hypothetical protein [Paenibacillus uliginis]|uniref:hypothetical protein n=1 Tax=Paenibacillus uliginis TaxID=683737 RepID=UPI00313D5141
MAPITNDGYGKGHTFAGDFAMFPLNWDAAGGIGVLRAAFLCGSNEPASGF